MVVTASLTQRAMMIALLMALVCGVGSHMSPASKMVVDNPVNQQRRSPERTMRDNLGRSVTPRFRLAHQSRLAPTFLMPSRPGAW